jgi:hypothetical protein
MVMLKAKSCRALVAQALSYCYFAGALSLPSDVSHPEDNIPRVRCRSRSLSDLFCNSLLFLNFHFKLCKSIQNSSFNKVKISEHFICVIIVCDVL